MTKITIVKINRVHYYYPHPTKKIRTKLLAKDYCVMNVDDKIWNECRARIKDKISAENYSTWFEPIRLHSRTEHELTLTIPNTFYKDCLEQNYLDLMQSTLDSFTQQTIKIIFALEDNTLIQQHEPPTDPQPKPNKKQ